MYIAYNLDSAHKIWSWVNVLYWILSCCLTPALSVLRYNRYRVPALLEEGETPFLQEESQDRLRETDKIFIIQPRWVKVCPGGLIKSAMFWIRVNFVTLDLNTLNWIHLWMKLFRLWPAGHSVNNMPITVDIFGGDPTFTASLSVLDLENPEANGEIYANWASSVKDFPQVIDQKVWQSAKYTVTMVADPSKFVLVLQKEFLTSGHGFCQLNLTPLLAHFTSCSSFTNQH